MSKKLTYYNVRGLAEGIRFMLYYSGDEFEDYRVDYSKWPIKEIKEASLFGQLPMYQEGDKVLNQSIAIARYVGQQAGLVPSDPWEQAVLDAVVLNVYDFYLEFTRYMLYYSKQEFEDVRYDMRKWPDAKIKESLPYHQFPLYEEGDRKLNQSLAIARYVAQKAGLVPSDYWEQAVLDAAVYNIFDFRSHFIKYFYEEDRQKWLKIKENVLNEKIDFYFSRFERELEANNGHFAISGKLSWADFVFVGIIDVANMILETKVETNYSNISHLVNEIRSLPGVKEYIQKRGEYSLKMLEK